MPPFVRQSKGAPEGCAPLFNGVFQRSASLDAMRGAVLIA
jgi:hypothetical protein